MDQRLFQAIKLGDLNKVRVLLARGASPNARNANGESALLLAAQEFSIPFDTESGASFVKLDGLYPILKLLLAQGAQVDATDKIGRTPLIVAATEGITQSVDALLDHGAQINHKDSYLGGTALMWAGIGQNTAMMLHLVRRGAEVNIPHNGGITALMIAVSAMRGDPADALDRTLAQALLDKGADVNAKDKQGKTVMIWAVDGFSNVGMLHALIKRGADIQARDNAGQTALMYAASLGNLVAARTLLESGAEVNAKDGAGATALTQATDGLPNWSTPQDADEKRRIETIKVLLDYGADPSTQELSFKGEYGGWTPLIYATMKNNLAAAQLLIQHGADVNTPNAWGMTPMAALLNDSFPSSPTLAKLLLDHGANVNAADAFGDTPLMAAVRVGQIWMVKFLIKSGASLSQKDKKGRTALRVAQEAHNPQIVALLKAS